MIAPGQTLSDDLVLLWDHRLVRALGRRPWVAGIIITVVLMASFLVPAWLMGVYEAIEAAEPLPVARTFGLDPYTWAAMVSSLLGGYAISISSYSLIYDARDLRSAAGILHQDEDDLIEAWISYQRGHVDRALIVSFVSWLTGLIIMLWVVPGGTDLLGFRSEPPLPWFQQTPAAWFLLFVPVIFLVIGKSAYFTIAGELFERDQRVASLHIDLFDPTAFAAFSRIALRRSFSWIVGSSISMLFLLNEAINRVSLAPLYGGIFIIAVLALGAPMYGIHRKIAAAKQAELTRVRTELARLKEQVLEGIGGGEAAQRLSGLVAYEARVERASEWPLDLPTLGRFTLYLGIPLLSWVGGALVERVVDVVL